MRERDRKREEREREDGEKKDLYASLSTVWSMVSLVNKPISEIFQKIFGQETSNTDIIRRMSLDEKII